MPGLTLRTVAPHESALIFSFLTIAARMEESNEPIQKALTDPALVKYWQDWSRPADLGIVAESAELHYPVGCAWVRLFPGEEPGRGHVADDIPELAFGVVKTYAAKASVRCCSNTCSPTAANATPASASACAKTTHPCVFTNASASAQKAPPSPIASARHPSPCCCAGGDLAHKAKSPTISGLYLTS